MKPDQRDQEANTVIRAIRDERNRRRAGKVGQMFHPPPPDDRYIWDNMGNGPYAAYDRLSQIPAIDVIGLMYDLGYHAAHPGGEAKALNEVDKELRRMVSETVMYADGPHLQMLVALAHRIIMTLYQQGELRKVIHEEGTS